MMVRSLLPEARVLPSGENATSLITSVWPFFIRLSCSGVLGSLTSHRMMVLSALPEAKVLPSGGVRQAPHLGGVAVRRLAELQRRPGITYIPQDDDLDHSCPRRGSCRPGEYATLKTATVWPFFIQLSCSGVLGSLTSHRMMVLSPLPEASVLPLGENAKLDTASV